jgi:FixJ family two-component response regulator
MEMESEREHTAMQIGPVAFFMKPFDDEQFLAAVHDAAMAKGLKR